MFDSIPHELKADYAWVNVWDGSKLPMQTRQRKAASSVDPTTWGTFENAVSNVEAGKYDGIGYVFHDNGIIGIDIDAGYDGDGFISALACDVLGSCRSYTEKSRSGRGFHVFVRGTLPFKGRNNNLLGVEIYRTARYFIMTGRTYLFRDIAENQAAIDYIVKTYFSSLVSESGDELTQRIYTPEYETPQDNKIVLRPTYPPIQPGGRNISLTSLAGQLRNQGYTREDIYQELLRANNQACKPPLPAGEVRSIVRSVMKYRR